VSQLWKSEVVIMSQEIDPLANAKLLPKSETIGANENRQLCLENFVVPAVL
jgi:hypothetical protein